MSSVVCSQCQKPLVSNTFVKEESVVVIFGCGHGFHSNCVTTDGQSTCPQCRTRATPMAWSVVNKETSGSEIRLRPDVEGHF